MIPSTSIVPPPDVTRELARLLPEYLPGVSTGSASLTEGSSCWIHAWKTPLTDVGRERSVDLLGSEQKVAARAMVIPRNRNLNFGDFGRLLPLPGSPYLWGDSRRESH